MKLTGKAKNAVAPKSFKRSTQTGRFLVSVTSAESTRGSTRVGITLDGRPQRKQGAGPQSLVIGH